MRSSARLLVLSSAACALIFIGLLVAVYHTAAGRRLDNAALDGFVAVLDSQTAVDVANAVARLCDPAPFAFITAAIVVAALVRSEPRRAAAAAALLLGSAVTTQLLKPALAGLRLDGSIVGVGKIITPNVEGAAFPSGHATAAMAIALAALIVSPRAMRPLVAAGGALFALGVGFAITALGWHFPSDIVGGYLVAATWCLLTLAGLRAAEEREPHEISASAAIGPAVALTGALVLAVAATRLDRVAHFASAHTTTTLAAMAIAVCATGVVTAVSLADRRAR